MVRSLGIIDTASRSDPDDLTLNAPSWMTLDHLGQRPGTWCTSEGLTRPSLEKEPPCHPLAKRNAQENGGGGTCHALGLEYLAKMTEHGGGDDDAGDRGLTWPKELHASRSDRPGLRTPT